jgi:hypothetical protein
MYIPAHREQFKEFDAGAISTGSRHARFDVALNAGGPDCNAKPWRGYRSAKHL